VLLFFTTPLWAQTGQYDYPIKNPYIATVVGTPASLKAILPEEKDVRSKEYELTVFQIEKSRLITGHLRASQRV
jgi:hypothetical protein